MKTRPGGFMLKYTLSRSLMQIKFIQLINLLYFLSAHLEYSNNNNRVIKITIVYINLLVPRAQK